MKKGNIEVRFFMGDEKIKPLTITVLKASLSKRRSEFAIGKQKAAFENRLLIMTPKERRYRYRIYALERAVLAEMEQAQGIFDPRYQKAMALKRERCRYK